MFIVLTCVDQTIIYVNPAQIKYLSIDHTSTIIHFDNDTKVSVKQSMLEIERRCNELKNTP